jgi:hypothetical protein
LCPITLRIGAGRRLTVAFERRNRGPFRLNAN